MTDPSTPHRPDDPSRPQHHGAGEFWTPPPTPPYAATRDTPLPAPRRSRRGLWRGLAIGAVAAAGLAVAIPAIAASNQQPTGAASAVTGYGESGQHGRGPAGGPGGGPGGAGQRAGGPGAVAGESSGQTGLCGPAAGGARPERPEGSRPGSEGSSGSSSEGSSEGSTAPQGGPQQAPQGAPQGSPPAPGSAPSAPTGALEG